MIGPYIWDVKDHAPKNYRTWQARRLKARKCCSVAFRRSLIPLAVLAGYMLASFLR